MRKLFLAAILSVALISQSSPGVAAGAVAVGQPADITKHGVVIYSYVGPATSERAKERALEGCKNVKTASPTARTLCKVVATFEDQCVADALDPEDGTPGFGWAIAPTSKQAKEQALSNCRDTAGPTRQDACVIVSRQEAWCDGSAK